MNIIFATDDNYARYAATAIVSLVRTHPGISLNIGILDSGMTEKSRERLKSLTTDKVNIRLHDLHRVQAFANRLNPETKLTAATFSRLLIPEILPDEQRALYLDSDVLVLKSLQRLYQEDMRGRALCMVRDNNIDAEFLRRRLNVHRYFNAGVILFDLERCRQLQFTRRWLEHLESAEQPLLCMDQDVINVVSQQEIGELPSVYNMQSSPSLQGNTRAILAVWEHIVVLHFITHLKPWLPISHPFDKIYLQAMLATPWKSDALTIRRRIRLHRLRCCFWHRRRYVTKKKEGIRTTYVLGIPLFSRHKSPSHRILYFLGIPFFIWHYRSPKL